MSLHKFKINLFFSNLFSLDDTDGCASFDEFCLHPSQETFPPLAPFTYDEIKDLNLICGVTNGKTEESKCRGMETVPKDGISFVGLDFKCDPKCFMTWSDETDLGQFIDASTKLLQCKVGGNGLWQHEAGVQEFPACSMLIFMS